MGDKGDLAAGDLSGDRRFAAFISYSHADTEVAAHLQRRLERYRLPKRISQMRRTPTAALGAIFRDREDLAAAASLSAAIQDAIARAEALIVICSPEAAGSQWVSAEIELFRKLHPEKPILAALVAGEPASSFPSALTDGGNEPLAADLRANGDGYQLGFLKIVAGIAGVPLDALIQRDAQRRIRRVTAITVGALAAMLIMGIMTAYAIQARNEAARQRAEAEGLVEYMLTDLRQRLKGVGRLDVMNAVNERAMEHYRRQGNLTDLPADALERRARILHAMGEDDQNRGATDEALGKFLEAHRTTRNLLGRQPQNPDRIFAHAQSEYWVGYVHYLHKDFSRAEKNWKNYLALAEQLSKLPGETKRGAVERGYATNNLCVLAVDRESSSADAVNRCGQAVEVQRGIAATSSKDFNTQLSYANSYAWYADAVEAHGDLQEARTLRLEQLKLIEALRARDPKNLDVTEFRLTALTAISRLDRKLGSASAARVRLRQLRAEALALRDHDPSNATWADRLERIDREIEILEGDKK